MPRHSTLPPAQRAELVLAVLKGAETLEVLARRHQISTNTLRRWRDEFVAAGQGRMLGADDASVALAENQRLQRELAERERIIGELTVANRFLQKKVDGSNGTTPSSSN